MFVSRRSPGDPAARAVRPRLLNEPVAIDVPETTVAGEPLTVVRRGSTHSVSTIIEQWRLDDGWWRTGPISRHYYRLQLDDGRLVTVFFDRERRSWWTQRV